MELMTNGVCRCHRRRKKSLIIGGYPDGTVRPNNNITRAETCAIVNRVLERRPHDEHLGDVEDMRTWPDNQPGAWYYADMQEANNGHYYEWIDIDGSKFEEWTEVDKDYDWTKTLSAFCL